MKFIENSEAAYIAQGKLQGYRQEFMCQAEAPELKPFKQEMMRVEPRVKTWQAVYSMTDPARTRNKNSADTGHAVWSWVGPKLVIWDAWGRQLLPNEIVDALFDTWDTYRPAKIGIEKDGLEEVPDAADPQARNRSSAGSCCPWKRPRARSGRSTLSVAFNPSSTPAKSSSPSRCPTCRPSCWASPPARSMSRTLWPMFPEDAARRSCLRRDFRGRNIGEDLRPSGASGPCGCA